MFYNEIKNELMEFLVVSNMEFQQMDLHCILKQSKKCNKMHGTVVSKSWASGNE